MPSLKDENQSLKNKLSEIETYKEDLRKEYSEKIVRLQVKVDDLTEKMDKKQRENDKLHTELNNKDKDIKNLKKLNKDLSESLQDERDKGFFSRLI